MLSNTLQWLLLAGFLVFPRIAVPSDSGLRPRGAGKPIELTSRNGASAPVMQSAYGRLPLHFEPNLGQFDRRVRYVARGGAYTLVLTDAEAVMVLGRTGRRPPEASPGRPEEASEVGQAVVRMKLVGARPVARWEALDRQPGISNYFLGNDPGKWRTDVSHYGRVAARGAYPGIDLVCYGNGRQFEYDLEVAPGADPSQVQLAWEGAESLKLNEDGDLVLATRLGDVVQKRPRVYQEVGGQRIEVDSRYVLAGANRVRFELARHDRHQKLLIDPVVLVYSTYLGGTGDDEGYGIAVDASGSAYITGTSSSIDFPTTQSADQHFYVGSYDAFVTKLTPDGTALVYSTYLGGSGHDEALGITVDGSGSAYVTGSTTSTDFPGLSSFQGTYQGGSSDAFVTKLAPAGNALVYSTYLGGSEQEAGYRIAVDGAGAAYVTGYTTSSSFPTQSAYQSGYQGGTRDVFVTKLAPVGNALAYSTYLGGSGDEWGWDIAVDGAGSAYVTGYTASANFPLQSAYQSANHGGSSEAFVTKLAPSGDSLVYSTYLGGAGADIGRGIALDGAGSAYVVGITDSNDFPTQSPLQANLKGAANAFVTKLAPGGSTLTYSTYLGGNGTDDGRGIAVDGAGSAWLTGFTNSTDFPTRAPYQSSYQGGPYDPFVTRLMPDGSDLVFSTYLAGNGEDRSVAIALDGSGSAYIVGYTNSTDYPIRAPYQSSRRGGTYDAFLTKLSGPPGTVALQAPADGSTGVPAAPTLSWRASPGAASYDVNFGTSSPPPRITQTVETSYAPGNLNSATRYYWQIVARNEAGSAASPIWSFTTAALALPAAPDLVSPSNGAAGVTPAPVLSWGASAAATSYDVHFGAAASPPLVTNTTGTSYAPPALGLSTTYYWQIVAKNSVGSAPSPIWWFTTGAQPVGLRFVPVTPCRVADTRFGGGAFGGPTVEAGSTRDFPIPQSGCNIPSSAQAYSLNVTVVPKGALSFLTLYPSGQSRPLVSTLNSLGGSVAANAAIVPAGTNGAVSAYVTNATDLILDINGYFDTSSETGSYWFYPTTPCRAADTRDPAGQFGGPQMYGTQSRDFPIPLSSCALPATARAYSLNVTVVPDAAARYLGFLTAWPTNQPLPNVSTLNSWTGTVVANAAIVLAGIPNESISVYASDPTDVILDVNGYFAGPGGAGALSFYPVTPCRVADTRNGSGPFGGPEMQAGQTRSFTIPAGACNISSMAAAYSVNVTVVPDGPLAYLTAWPTGSERPSVSTLNSFDGAVVANAAIAPAGTNGAVSIYVTNRTHVILDINGYFAP